MHLTRHHNTFLEQYTGHHADRLYAPKALDVVNALRSAAERDTAVALAEQSFVSACRKLADELEPLLDEVDQALAEQDAILTQCVKEWKYPLPVPVIRDVPIENDVWAHIDILAIPTKKQAKANVILNRARRSERERKRLERKARPLRDAVTMLRKQRVRPPVARFLADHFPTLVVAE